MELRKALKLALSLPAEESDKIFQNAKIDSADTSVNFGKPFLSFSYSIITIAYSL